MPRSVYFLLLLPGLLAADQVVLKNGDTITGAIIKKDGGKLTIKSEFLGEVTMPWTAVKSIRSDEVLTVTMPEGRSAAGKVTTEGNLLEVETAEGAKPAPLDQVVAVRNAAEQHAWERLQHPSLLELWSGFVDTGLALARGNARTDTLTTNIVATRTTTNDKIAVTFNQIYGTATINNVSSAVASAIRANWTYNRDVSANLFLATLNGYEHDRFQDLDLRFVAGGGLGWKGIKRERTTLALTLGADYEREQFMQGVNRNSAEANFGDDFTYKLNGTTSVAQEARFFSNLSDTGQYRFNFNLGTVTMLKKWLGFHVTAADSFLSNPLFGRQRNDVLISTGLRLSFAR